MKNLYELELIVVNQWGRTLTSLHSSLPKARLYAKREMKTLPHNDIQLQYRIWKIEYLDNKKIMRVHSKSEFFELELKK